MTTRGEGRPVILIGDSQAEGLASALRSALPLVGMHLRLVIAQSGISTSRLAQDADIASAYDPDALVLVVLGGNDTANANLTAAITRLRELLPRDVVWVGPMTSSRADVDARHRGVAALQAQLLPQLGVRWVDGARLSSDLELAADGVHLTADSRVILAQRIAALLVPRQAALLAGGLVGIGLGFVTAWLWRRLR